jgi:hypothetical protein
MNANKGVFGVNLGHMWGEIDRQRQWADQLLNLWTQGAIKPKVARVFPFALASASFRPRSQEYRQSAFSAVISFLMLPPRIPKKELGGDMPLLAKTVPE